MTEVYYDASEARQVDPPARDPGDEGWVAARPISDGDFDTGYVGGGYGFAGYEGEAPPDTYWQVPADL
jgi:hypothetical protein